MQVWVIVVNIFSRFAVEDVKYAGNLSCRLFFFLQKKKREITTQSVCVCACACGQCVSELVSQSLNQSMSLCLPFKLLNYIAAFHDLQYELLTARDHPKAVLLNFLQQVINVGRKTVSHKLVNITLVSSYESHHQVTLLYKY